ncbi:DUF4367 domain-containing protein [Carboxydothermus hydrogenoformans]|uniref:DUF4367 domain-containing protein n=1 Tax=Carboxydothermus hydrogenoformans (strain ATCC BAA-161 / DSM 6008 / Z-2901) TaxID=246194 RepID=Q3AAW5_CARHZ|nr:DUF4367 domain-containing protein [Carboxydothermus hydrogenoformans]ABB15624.1 hypothetical protein CHY_1899 [Carboxydothermus hydrogenoformans Z-2901]
MKYLKMWFLISFILILIFSGYLYALAENNNKVSARLNSNYSSINSNNNEVSLPYNLKIPKYLPRGLVFKKKTVENVGALKAVIQGWQDIKNERRFLVIIQSNDNGNTKPNEINDAKKIKIAGTDAWLLYESEGEPVKIMFWKDNCYYLVGGLNISVDDLTKVAESLFE